MLDLKARLASFGVDPEQPLALALSGGPDSVALMLLAQQAQLSIEAIIIDHAMRAGSAEEAEIVRARAERQGVAAQVHRLTQVPKPSSMASARDGRYAALQTIARGRPILVAHHRDDQIETVALRLERGSGWRGLAGMSARNGATVRPLLDVPKQALLDLVAQANCASVDDPSNRNLRFRRPFIRARLNDAPKLAEDLYALSQTFGRLRAFVEREALVALETGLAVDALKVGRLPSNPLVRVEMLRRLVEAVSGRFDCDLDPLSDQLPTGFGCRFKRAKGLLRVELDPRSKRHSTVGPSMATGGVDDAVTGSHLSSEVFCVVKS